MIRRVAGNVVRRVAEIVVRRVAGNVVRKEVGPKGGQEGGQSKMDCILPMTVN